MTLVLFTMLLALRYLHNMFSLCEAMPKLRHAQYDGLRWLFLTNAISCNSVSSLEHVGLDMQQLCQMICVYQNACGHTAEHWYAPHTARLNNALQHEFAHTQLSVESCGGCLLHYDDCLVVALYAVRTGVVD